MDGETSPFIETSYKKGGTIRLADSIDASYVVNIIVVIILVYILYIAYSSFAKDEDDSDDECDNEKSYVEEQIERLNSRQERNL